MKEVLKWNPKDGSSRKISMPDELAENGLKHFKNITELDAENPFGTKKAKKEAAKVSDEVPEKKAKKEAAK